MVISNCPLCEAHCGLEVEVVGGRVTASYSHKHDSDTRGFVCSKGRALLELQNSPERLRAPLRRNAHGGLHPIGWEETNANILTHYGAPAYDPISGFPSWRAFQARAGQVDA